ncbi:hypothetical protein EG329_007382 [Mollisiaceae sp. DMI_Dod_QoI]|nr:hypothetical protein EG329_007382 [Helotiales sp. DMI_Dod_QoI]
MSHLLKELEPAKGQDFLQKTLEEARGLQPGARRSSRATLAQSSQDQQRSGRIIRPEDPQPNIANPATTASSANTQEKESVPVGPSSSSYTMSSQRNRLGRSNGRGGSQDTMSVQALWGDFNRDIYGPLRESELRAKQLTQRIIDLEIRLKHGQENGGAPLSDYDALDALYREQVKISEESKQLEEGMKVQMGLMIDMQRHNEQAAAEKSARASSSRTSGMDFDGPSDSLIPSPADNRQVRKLGTSRTGSLPPSRADGTPSEASERVSKPKIVYAQNEEVAFKRKTPGKPEEQDWIQGRVVRVIGEGKSRRYDVEDPFPDNNASSVIYKSSASQMVPIPPEGSPLEDYEIGKRVLALYPDTTTFYRAEVKAMLDGGASVQLLFEDEAAGELKIVTRRFVLDHKG